MGLALGSGPKVPPTPKTCPGFRPSGTRRSCGSGDTQPASRFVAQALHGLARSAKGSRPESRGLSSPSARLPSWGSPTSLLGGGLGRNCRSGLHPAEHEAGGNNSNINAVAVSLARQSPARQTKLD